MTASLTLLDFVKELAAKQPTPGGGGAAAVAGAIGASAAHMAANYTTRKKDVESGAASEAEALMKSLDGPAVLTVADADASAYADLQRSWKDTTMSSTDKAAIEARALNVPISLLEQCVAHICEIEAFLPVCNPNITSDAKVGIHLLAGAARAAYQTAVVNKPPAEELERLAALLRQVRAAEDRVLGLCVGNE